MDQQTNTGPIMDAAFRRALFGALLVGLSTFFVMLPQTDDWKLLLSGVGGGVVGVLISRFGGEGLYDARRAENGNINRADVPVVSKAVDVVPKP